MTELSVGANHPDIFWRLHNLFKVAIVRQDLTQAEHLLRRARAVTDQQAAATHAEMKALIEEDTHLLRAQVKSATEPHLRSHKKRAA